MSQQIDAIYDNGMFRPLEPLVLPDQSKVKLTVEAELPTEDAEKLARQKAALRAAWEEIDQLPQHQNHDGWSVRQHDQILYGKQ